MMTETDGIMQIDFAAPGARLLDSMGCLARPQLVGCLDLAAAAAPRGTQELPMLLVLPCPTIDPVRIQLGRAIAAPPWQRCSVGRPPRTAPRMRAADRPAEPRASSGPAPAA